MTTIAKLLPMKFVMYYLHTYIPITNLHINIPTYIYLPTYMYILITNPQSTYNIQPTY